jgi:predicted phosphodiesterase
MRALVLYDIHEPYSDAEALALALEEGRKQKVDLILLAGDAVDFYRISFWKSDPLRMEFHEEVECVKTTLQALRKQFKKATIHYLAGNHEQRLKSYLWSKAPELAGLTEILSVPALLELPKLEIEYFDNIQSIQAGGCVYKLGMLHIIHGHEFRVTYSAVNLAKIYYERAKVNVMVGHHHRTQEWIVRKLNGKVEGCYAVGALCNLAPDYSPLNSWNHGFAIIEVDDNGYFSVQNLKIIEGVIV